MQVVDVDWQWRVRKEIVAMKRFANVVLVCVLLSMGCLSGCGPGPPTVTPCATDATKPEITLEVLVNGEGRPAESAIVGTAAEDYSFIAKAEDECGVKHIQVHIEGGEATKPAGTESHSATPVAWLSALGNLKALKSGDVVTLWAEAEDQHGHRATTDPLTIVCSGTWQIRLERLRVANANEDDAYSNGDEPYFVVFGFRSRLKTPGSTSVSWRGYLEEAWAAGVTAGGQRDIPEAMGLVHFSDVRPMTRDEFFDELDVQIDWKPVELEDKIDLEVTNVDITLPRMEFVGAIAVAMESDGTPWGDVRALVESLRRSLEEDLTELMEVELPAALEEELENILREPLEQALEEALTDLVQGKPIDADELQRAVIEDNSGAIVAALNSVFLTYLDSSQPEMDLNLLEVIQIAFRSWFDLDDLIDYQPILFAAVDPKLAAELQLPYPGLEDTCYAIGSNPIVFTRKVKLSNPASGELILEVDETVYEVTLSMSAPPLAKAGLWTDFTQIDKDMIGKIGNHGDGSGVAFANLNDDPRPEMILMAYDDPDGQNNFRYVIGWDVDTEGQVSQWDARFTMIQVEGIGLHGDGAGLAFANLNDDPRPEMILMAYDRPDGQNNFRYVIGWDVGTEGKASRWDEKFTMVRVDGIGLHGDGAGVAIANLNDDPRLEMVLMAYDDPADRYNSFRYVIGWDLDSKGKATRWDRRFTSVAGVGTQAEGADLLVTNLDKDPRPEMVLMAYDAPKGLNSFRYKVGWNLDSNGKTTLWSRTTQVDGVGSVGDGAGMTFVSLDNNSRPELVVMAYDDADGQNSFRYKIGWDVFLTY
jgi:hypothetical protein